LSKGQGATEGEIMRSGTAISIMLEYKCTEQWQKMCSPAVVVSLQLDTGSHDPLPQIGRKATVS